MQQPNLQPQLGDSGMVIINVIRYYHIYITNELSFVEILKFNIC